MSKYTFDPTTHTHRIDGYEVEGVTTVLRDLIPGYSADQWYLDRGTAVHACAAMIADRVEFESDPQIDGQVQALKAFHKDVAMVIESVELPVFSLTYRYAGIADLIAKVGDKRMVIDYKGSFSASMPYQLAGYGLCIKPEIRYGMGVEIHADGTYKLSEVYDLRRYKQEWLALLTAYRVRRKCKVKEIVE